MAGKSKKQSNDEPNGKPKRGRPRKFDDEALQKQAVVLRAIGCSYENIASFLEIDEQTVTDEIKHNPQFAAAMARALSLPAIKAKRKLNKLFDSKDDAVAFRAVTWYLERREWEEWSKRKQGQITPEEFVRIIILLGDWIREGLPKRYHRNVLESISRAASVVDVIDVPSRPAP